MAKPTYDELIDALKGQASYVRSGNSYQQLVMEGVSLVKGELSLIYGLSEKMNPDGSKVTRKPRTPKAPEAKTAKK